MKGIELEAVVIERLKQERAAGRACVGRYGVQAARSKDDWIIQSSLPDFEGVFADGRQLIFDAKVCGQASFNLAKYREETRGARSRQLRHMLDRSRFGATCFFLIHWTERRLTKRVDPSITYALPVHPSMPLWQEFDAAERKSVTRGDCEFAGVQVPWTLHGDRDRKPRPDVIGAAEQVARLILVPSLLSL